MISKLRPVPGQFRALCCVCGEVRRFSARYAGGGRIDDRGLPDQRCTIDLKCDVCRRRTRHAFLLDFAVRPDAAERSNLDASLQGYDPFRAAAERWPDWNFTETPLPDGIIEIIDLDRREAYFDRAGWAGDAIRGLAHVLAHLDLGHHELYEAGFGSDELEDEAEEIARERLDDPRGDG